MHLSNNKVESLDYLISLMTPPVIHAQK